MTDHVVQLAGDTGALLGDGPAHLLLLLQLQLRGPLLGLLALRGALPQHEPGHPRDDEKPWYEEEFAARAVRIVRDDDDRAARSTMPRPTCA